MIYLCELFVKFYQCISIDFWEYQIRKVSAKLAARGLAI